MIGERGVPSDFSLQNFRNLTLKNIAVKLGILSIYSMYSFFRFNNGSLLNGQILLGKWTRQSPRFSHSIFVPTHPSGNTSSKDDFPCLLVGATTVPTTLTRLT